jgi:gamma-glutamylputrescine oxidase
MHSAHSHYHAHASESAAFDPFPNNDELPVVIVGGGFAGINTALSLAERGVKSVVLEAHQIGFGASGRNGGFVFAGYSRGEAALLKLLGPELAKAWYQHTVSAVNLIRERIAREGIECDQTDQGVIWANVFSDDAVLSRRQSLLQEHFDSHWQRLDQTQMQNLIHSKRYTGGLFERNAMHLNPLKLVRGLARAAQRLGARVVENCAVQGLVQVDRSAVDRQRSQVVRSALDQHKSQVARSAIDTQWQVKTPQGVLHAKHVLLACGGYWQAELARSIPALRQAVMPIATYVMASEPMGARLQDVIQTGAAIYDTRFAFDYYRALPDTRLLWGGRIHVLDAPPKQVEQRLRADMLRVFPQLRDLKIERAWSGMMSYARHEMPQIGQSAPGLWYAQAFGGHGLAPTCVAGEVIAEAIANGDERYLQLSQFGLQRTFGALGLTAAQCTYWWLQSLDAWHEWRGVRAISLSSSRN